jgi:hypothetical protein
VSLSSRSPTGSGALLATAASGTDTSAHGPGAIVLDGQGRPESVLPGAEHWIGQMVGIPPPAIPAESKIIQAVAGRARGVSHHWKPAIALVLVFAREMALGGRG